MTPPLSPPTVPTPDPKSFTPATEDRSFEALLARVAHVPDVEPPGTLGPGHRLTPTLTLVRELGTGGMSTVWEATCSALGRRVAVKVLQRRTGAYAVHEAAALERLRHPRIVRMFSFGVTAEGQAYIVMELLGGHSLATEVRERGPLGLEETSALVEQAADALSHAHGAGLLHRDIKPSNIQLVDTVRELDVRLIDFGISHDVPWSTPAPAKRAGTPGYMSPEQERDPSRIDGRADLWSLAATVHFALTGERPHRDARASLPVPIRAWLERGLSHEPRDRFRTPREMAAAFTAAARLCTASDPLTRLGEVAAWDPAARPLPLLPPSRRARLRPIAFLVVLCGVVLLWALAAR